MKVQIFILSIIAISAPFAEACPQDVIIQNVLQAAISIESINSGGSPKAKEYFRYASDFDKWSITLINGSVDSNWTVDTIRDNCQIKAVYR